MKAFPILAGGTGMVLVGGSVAVSGHLADAPDLTVQALRYGVACLLLLAWARRTRTALHRPRGREWLWLLGVTGAGLLVFNIALVHGARHAEPAVLGVAVACVPILLAVGGPWLTGHAPAARVLFAAGVVTLGAILVEGLGRADGAGVLWAVVTFACEALFTLLAIPVLGRHGPLGVSVHATWLATVLFGVFGVLIEGPAAVLRLHLDDVLAGAYLAVAVTAVAFLLWYTCVARLGPGRAGLLTGVAPVSAALTGMALGGPAPRPLVWLGIATVAAGLALGLTTHRRTPPGPDRAARSEQDLTVESESEPGAGAGGGAGGVARSGRGSAERPGCGRRRSYRRGNLILGQARSAGSRL
ncbi:DMT family transporter [Actinoplanes regularis]|uniref:Permease of the drug/metabolite transporter (DMT) superfamily n=1 Tax=Actinoplanes regularis TaxID=52697 RepID=A0A238WAY1_9ACTN|nr:DMT family transporter [Actinoplanes regularis]GIE85090.1 membrane protein [Actinoplanes regularis]SNR43567.1 Permease of the drug/metabolite transporter (DMT) superfamily [Actinoplanes regularis]